MPKVVLEIPNSYETITRPVVRDVVASLFKTTGIPEDTEVVFPGMNGAVVNPDSTLTKSKTSVRLENGDRVFVEMEEQFVEDNVLSTAVYLPENQLTFADPKLNIYMRPVYAQNEVTLTVRYRSNDRNTVTRWRNECRRRSSQLRAELLHDVHYHYLIPKEQIVILVNLFEMRERVAGYGDTMKQWFDASFKPTLRATMTQAGTEPHLVFPETQIGVMGWFDFTSNPAPIGRPGDADCWEASFAYTFRFDQVLSNVLDYPILIHNQVVSPAFRQTEEPYRLENQLRNPSWSGVLMSEFRNRYPGYMQTIDGYRIPKYDDWLPRGIPANTTTVFSVLTTVDPANPRELFNITQLGTYSIEPLVLTYITDTYSDLCKLNHNAFHVSLYKGGNLLPDGSITIDAALNITATADLDIRSQYHVRIAVLNNLFCLSEQKERLLREHGAACNHILMSLYPDLLEMDALPKLVGGRYVSKVAFQAAAKRINDTNHQYQTSVEVRRLTAGYIAITARSETE